MAWDKTTRPKGRGVIGFCELRLFNQALLGRQAWRLLEKPDSLCATLLKAKYYPQGHLLDTAFPRSVSLTWEGIMYGLHLLKHGVIRRVYDGKNINIQLPRNSGLKLSEKRCRSRLMWVSGLIVPSTKRWDEDLVRHIFSSHDAQAVLNLHIPSRPSEDFVA